MRRAVPVLMFVLALATAPALAGPHGGHGGHGLSLGFHFGVPFAWHDPYYSAPAYYYPPPYYYPPAVAAPPSAPPAYVERGDAPPAPAQSWWYYCEDSRAYYPYIKTCPSGWTRVSPTPPAE